MEVVDSAQLLSIALKCPAKAETGRWSRRRPDVFSEGETAASAGGFSRRVDGSLLDGVLICVGGTAAPLGDERRQDGQKSFSCHQKIKSLCCFLACADAQLLSAKRIVLAV